MIYHLGDVVETSGISINSPTEFVQCEMWVGCVVLQKYLKNARQKPFVEHL